MTGSTWGHFDEIRCCMSTCAYLPYGVEQISTSLVKGPHFHHRLQHTTKDDWTWILSMASIPHNPFAVPFFTTHFEKCQTSYWWFIWGRSLFNFHLSSSRLSIQRLKPSFSMAYGIRGSDLGNLDHTEHHYFTTVIVHCVSAKIGSASRAVTTPITI